MDAWSPLWLALRAAFLSTAIALALGPWLAFALLRRPALTALAGLPLTIATPLLATYSLLANAPRWTVAAMLAVPFSLPYLVRASAAAYDLLDPIYFRAARSLGASEWRVFREIAAPLARGPILAAASFAFACLATDYATFLLLARALRVPGPVGAAPLAAAAIIGLAVHYLGSRLDRRRSTV